MLYLIGIVLCLISIGNITNAYHFLKDLKKERKEKLDTSKTYEIPRNEKRTLVITILIIFFILLLFTFIVKTGGGGTDEEMKELKAFCVAMIFLMFSTILNWYTLIKKEIVNEEVKRHRNQIGTVTSKNRISKYSTIIVTTICSIVLCVLFSTTTFAENLTKISYKFNTSEIKKMYQEQYVPVIENNIQTENLPDVNITVNRCLFKELDYDDAPIYTANFNYSSQVIDNYYESAIHSSYGAKELFYIILEVNAEKNYYEAEKEVVWDGEPFESNKTIIEFKEDDRFEMTIKSEEHTYKIENRSWVDRLYIDNKLVYELDKTKSDSYDKPSYDKPNYDSKPEKPSYNYSKPSNSSGNGGKYDSYDDGYNSVVEDGDYDYDRYYEDDDYRDGVDDALDEMGENY